VGLLRSAKSDAFLAGDILVGFPGESEEDFRKTRRLVKKLELARIHVFPFSPRPGTAAYRLRPQVPEYRKKQRVGELMQISSAQLTAYARRWKGSTVTAILEGSRLPGGKGRGVSDNYLKLEIIDIPKEDFRPSALVSCRIEESGNPCRARFLRYCA
jgi:threonylcarbamoyladenosine tRNA methylthiotransferase MtaB